MKALNKTRFIALIFCIFAVGNSANAEGLLSATSPAGFVFSRDFTLGAYGDDVSILQQFLMTGNFLKIPATTGYFGQLTKTALSEWQASAGIYPSAGFFGPISREKINAIFQQVLIDAALAQNMSRTTTAAVATTSAAIANNNDGSPVRLRITKLNIDAGFQYNGLKSDGSMEIPNNIYDVGWFTGSPHPGEKGVSIITGHVAQIRGGVLTRPGVFYYLNNLKAGDELSVINDRGESIVFVVRESRSYDPTMDATDVFLSKDNGKHLNLITCEGTWIPSQLSYTQRLVVFTDVKPQTPATTSQAIEDMRSQLLESQIQLLQLLGQK